MSKLYPKCKNLSSIYMSASGQILPCCDVSLTKWNHTKVEKWDLKNNDIDSILTDITQWADLAEQGKATLFNNCSSVCGKPTQVYKNSPNTHLELSTRCTLQCPKCPRTVGLKNGLELIVEDLSLEYAKQIISRTDNPLINICGSLGDPIFNKNLTEIVKYIEYHNKRFILSTAAPGRSLKWWKEFYNSFNTRAHNIRFGLDGLEDTAHLYRIGTSFNNIFSAMKLGVELKKNIQWQVIPFKFNEHQIETIKQICNDTGIEFFMRKSNRWDENDPLEPVNPNYKFESRKNRGKK